MPKSSEMLRALRFAWLGLCLAVLVMILSAGPNPEQGIIWAYAMLAITFPMGFAAAYLVAFIGFLLENLFGYIIPYDPIANIATWVLFVAFGYMQWFILLPWLLRKFLGRGAIND